MVYECIITYYVTIHKLLLYIYIYKSVLFSFLFLFWKKWKIETPFSVFSQNSAVFNRESTLPSLDISVTVRFFCRTGSCLKWGQFQNSLTSVSVTVKCLILKPGLWTCVMNGLRYDSVYHSCSPGCHFTPSEILFTTSFHFVLLFRPRADPPEEDPRSIVTNHRVDLNWF